MAGIESWAKLRETRKRLEKCWELDLDWSLYPQSLKKVTDVYYNIIHDLHVHVQVPGSMCSPTAIVCSSYAKIYTACIKPVCFVAITSSQC
jgi:hypothetical protein